MTHDPDHAHPHHHGDPHHGHGHHHGHGQPVDFDQPQDEAFWDEMYRRRADRPFDPDPNPFLPEDLAGLAPGAALDVGCGEGSDAVWLADRGWRVTAVDISDVALARGRAADPAGRVEWVRADILAWEPPAAAFDLVTTHFLHLKPEGRPAFFAGLGRAVRPGGQLLVVAHHPSDLETNIGRPPLPELFFTAEEVQAALAPADWDVAFAGKRPREARGRDGEPVVIHDMVFRARRKRGALGGLIAATRAGEAEAPQSELTAYLPSPLPGGGEDGEEGP